MQEWKTGCLLPLLRGESPQPDFLEDDIVLLKADTNRTQDYVFESARLPEIRGGSLQLSVLNGDLKLDAEADFSTMLDALHDVGLNEHEVVYLGGGNLLALLPNKDTATQLAEAIQTAYPQETRIVTITVVYITCKASDLLETDRFQDTLEALETKLKFAKQQFRPSAFFERLPFAETCRSCQIRPASMLSTRPGDQDYPICVVCDRKADLGKDRSHWSERIFKDFEIDPASDLEDLGDLSNDKIAFIYADGDGFRNYMLKASSIEDYRARSNAISALVYDAAAVALEKLHQQSIARKRLTYELITIGGDDVLLIVPAKYAFDVAQDMMAVFERQGEGLSLSVGIALGRFNSPVRVLRDIALTALKQGAKRRRRECNDPHGYLDFHDLVREGYFSESQRDPDRAMLTARPYTLEEFDRLRAFSRKLNNALSKSMLEALSAEVETERAYGGEGQERSKLFFLYQYSRLNKQGDRKKVEEALVDFHSVDESVSDLDFVTDWIWQTQTCNGTSRRVTPIQDMVTLIDIIGKGQDADHLSD